MRRALELAAAVEPAAVKPNPRVGTVITREDQIIGEGAHAHLGEWHAERAALADCERRGQGSEGATAYVTLEPCAHQGRQPPCADALIEAGIARVVIASSDPSGRASGRGPVLLRDAGIEVELLDATCEDAAAARALNQPFRKHARTGVPLVTLKLATSLDGRAATASGDSHWISGDASRALVHRWRSACDVVAVGIGTALADDPLLTARDVGASRQPLRVVFDSGARLPAESRLLATLEEAPLLVLTAPGADPGRVAALRATGAEVLPAAGDSDAERIRAALALLGARGVTDLMLEGGPRLGGSFLEADEVDVVRQFIAPIQLGGDRTAIEAPPVELVGDAPRAVSLACEPVGSDVLLTARLREW